MEWNKKYNYPKSTRAILNGRRHYDVNNEKLPSVTTIISATMPLEKKERLERWRNQIGPAQAEIIKKEAATRGATMHEILEKFLLGKLNLDLLGDNSREKLMADQIIERGIRGKVNVIWGCEATLYYPGRYGYAGAADLICGDYEGKSAIVDFKNSSKARQDHWNEDFYLQVSGYIAAHNKVYKTSIDQGIILICTKDNFFQRFIIEGERLKEYQNKFFERVEQYYSQKNN